MTNTKSIKNMSIGDRHISVSGFIVYCAESSFGVFGLNYYYIVMKDRINKANNLPGVFTLYGKKGNNKKIKLEVTNYNKNKTRVQK